jgi:Fe/S biogenesis protein NfuA
MVKFSDVAREKILGLIRGERREGLALRFAIQGRGPGGFQYRLGLVEPSDKQPADRVVDAGGFQVYVDPESAARLEGVSVDYVEGPEGSGFKIDNPNPMWSDPKAQAVQRVLDEEINPAVAMHGGWVTLIDVKDDIVYIQLGGGCQGCGMVDVTLRQGIEVRIREVVPEIREIIDATDHAGGRNPYYQPAKGAGGASPFA